MKQTIAILILVILLSATANATSPVPTHNLTNIPTLAMQVEHINYTITEKNGFLWATIDGEYPISIRNFQNPISLPMLYPMPPQSANITVNLDGKDIPWTNYTQTNLLATHKTALGDWWQISCRLENVSETFNLRIHYEHPLEVIDGQYVFLYDLNIKEYLSEENPQSTAYFTIRFKVDIGDLHVYTAPPDSSSDSWKPKRFILTQEGIDYILKVEMISELATMLPGDVAIGFSKGSTNDNSIKSSAWIFRIAAILLASFIVFITRKSLSRLFSRETAN